MAAVDEAERDPEGWAFATTADGQRGTVLGNRVILGDNRVLVAVASARRAGDRGVLAEVEAALEEVVDGQDDLDVLSDLATTYELARMLGVKRSTVRKWTERPVGFPQPRLRLGRRGSVRLYSRQEIQEWRKSRNRRRHKRRSPRRRLH